MIQIKQISVAELKAKRDRKDEFVLIDVREKDEYAICAIEGSKLIPLSQFASLYREIPQDKEIVVHCHHGGRSQKACEFLAAQGYQNVCNVTGGIHEWSVEIDPEVAQY